jgi:hypothetical protein
VTDVGAKARTARRGTCVATVACLCLLPAQSSSAAHGGDLEAAIGAQPVTVEAPGVGHGRHAEHAAKDAGAPLPPAVVAPPPPVPALSEPVGVGAKRHPQANAPAAASTTSAAGRSRAVKGATSAARGRGHASAPSATSLTATPAGAALDTAAAAVQSVESAARKTKKGGGKTGGRTAGGKKHKGTEGSNGQTEGSTQAEGTGSNEGGTSGKHTQAAPATSDPAATATAASSTAPPAPVGVAAPPIVAPAASAATAAAVPGLHASRTVRRAAHTRHNARHAAATGAVAAVAAFAPATPLLVPSSSESGAVTRSHRHSGRARTNAPSSEPAIVHTITRIVNVVPGPIRILIAALAALALALGLRSLLSGIRTRRLVRQRGELLADVGLLQAALLPVPPPRLGPVGTSVAYRPAEGPGAGGDFYDLFALEAGQLAVIVGDVSGHGREALPHTALIRFTVRAYLEAGLDPAKALQTAGTVLERQLGDSFATVLAAVYHPRERTLTYAAAGHPPPVVLGEADASGARRAIAPVTACSAPPLGAGMRTGTRQTVVSIPGPARVCVHTDGVTEARVGEDLFGAERLSRSLAALPDDAGAAELLDSVTAQSTARPDDMGACVLHIHGGSGAPAIVHEQLELDARGLTDVRVRGFLEDCGVSRTEAAATVERAGHEPAGTSMVSIDIARDGGASLVTVHGENPIRAAALTAVGAS